MATRLLFVRHGETSYNALGRIQGRLDIPLNERGFEQAAAVGAALADVPIGELYSSSLSRARETAVGIARQHAHLTAPGAPFWIDDRLQERGFGSLEGIVYGVPGVRKRDSIDGIEQMNDFNERLASALTDILAGPAPWHASGPPAESVSGYLDSTTQLHPPESSSSNGHKAAGSEEVRTIVIVGHGASISALLGEVLLDAGYAALAPGVQRSRVWNCSITELELSAEGLQKLKSAAGAPSAETEKLQAGHRERKQSWLIRPPHVLQQQNAKGEGVVPEELKGVFVVRRWADVSHIGPAQANTLVKNADEELEKQTRKG